MQQWAQMLWFHGEPCKTGSRMAGLDLWTTDCVRLGTEYRSGGHLCRASSSRGWSAGDSRKACSTISYAVWRSRGSFVGMNGASAGSCRSCANR